MKRFVEGDDRKQVALLPECIDDYIGQDNPVRVIDAFVDDLAGRSFVAAGECTTGEATGGAAAGSGRFAIQSPHGRQTRNLGLDGIEVRLGEAGMPPG